jgi:large subunit ribosomal protein L6
MSRIGKQPVAVPAGVNASYDKGEIRVKGPKGELSMTPVDLVVVELADGEFTVKPVDETKLARSMWGMQRTLIANMIHGVSEGFEKNLELVGVGYRAQMAGSTLKLALGLSHDVDYNPRNGIKIEVGKPTEIKISGADKQAVGQTAAEIRSYRPPEPYKGKGIKYAGEFIRRKEGKKK